MPLWTETGSRPRNGRCGWTSPPPTGWWTISAGPIFWAPTSRRACPARRNAFLINPYGLLFEEITASSLVKVDEEGTILSETDYPINPAGFTIHSAVHMARPEVACAIHTHTAAGIGVATQKDGLLPLTQNALIVIAQTGYHDYEGIATDLDERERIVADLADNNVLILRNHGLLTVGRSVGEAFVWLYRTERACQLQLAFQQSGAEPSPIPEHVASDHHRPQPRGHLGDGPPPRRQARMAGAPAQARQDRSGVQGVGASAP